MNIDWKHLIDNLLWVGCKISWSAVTPGEVRSFVFGIASCAKHRLFFHLIADAVLDTYVTWLAPSPPILYDDRLSAAGGWRIRWLLPHQHWTAAPITASTSLSSVFVSVLYLVSWLSVALEVRLLGHLRLSSGLARAISEQLLFRLLCLCVFAEKCLTSVCFACSVPASFHVHS